jgi:hypothetical protein
MPDASAPNTAKIELSAVVTHKRPLGLPVLMSLDEKNAVPVTALASAKMVNREESESDGSDESESDNDFDDEDSGPDYEHALSGSIAKVRNSYANWMARVERDGAPHNSVWVRMDTMKVCRTGKSTHDFTFLFGNNITLPDMMAILSDHVQRQVRLSSCRKSRRCVGFDFKLEGQSYLLKPKRPDLLAKDRIPAGSSIKVYLRLPALPGSANQCDRCGNMLDETNGSCLKCNAKKQDHNSIPNPLLSTLNHATTSAGLSLHVPMDSAMPSETFDLPTSTSGIPANPAPRSKPSMSRRATRSMTANSSSEDVDMKIPRNLDSVPEADRRKKRAREMSEEAPTSPASTPSNSKKRRTSDAKKPAGKSDTRDDTTEIAPEPYERQQYNGERIVGVIGFATHVKDSNGNPGVRILLASGKRGIMHANSNAMVSFNPGGFTSLLTDFFARFGARYFEPLVSADNKSDGSASSSSSSNSHNKKPRLIEQSTTATTTTRAAKSSSSSQLDAKASATQGTKPSDRSGASTNSNQVARTTESGHRGRPQGMSKQSTSSSVVKMWPSFGPRPESPVEQQSHDRQSRADRDNSNNDSGSLQLNPSFTASPTVPLGRKQHQEQEDDAERDNAENDDDYHMDSIEQSAILETSLRPITSISKPRFNGSTTGQPGATKSFRLSTHSSRGKREKHGSAGKRKETKLARTKQGSRSPSPAMKRQTQYVLVDENSMIDDDGESLNPQRTYSDNSSSGFECAMVVGVSEMVSSGHVPTALTTTPTANVVFTHFTAYYCDFARTLIFRL